MSTAGGSAWREAERARALADAHEAEAQEQRRFAERMSIAAKTETRTAQALAPLAPGGFHFLNDRRWPNSRSAQVDLILVGPSGVWIVDTKAWRDLTIAVGRVYRDQEDVTEAFENLADLGETTRTALAEVGLPPGEVHVLVAWAGRKGINAEACGVEIVGDADALRHIVKPGTRLSDTAIDAVLQATADLFPPVSAPAPVNTTIPEPVLPTVDLMLQSISTPSVELAQDDAGARQRAPRHGRIEAPILGAQPAKDEAPLPSEAETRQAIFDSLMLSEPVEEWMTFLHPDQAKLVRRSFGGPARIRGGAGTGKTVVGLHRAAHLARTKPEGKVLVTTYVRTLPAVLRSLLTRLAPDVADRVEFFGVHEFAKSVLGERGVHTRMNPAAMKRARDDAWWGPAGRALSTVENNRSYWEEEVENVIKGRGFTTFEQYAACARHGRSRALQHEQRRKVWAFYSEYEHAKRKAGTNDWADPILLLEQELRKQPLRGYSAVIVDEAQDLSLAMIRALHSLVGDEPDAFTLIGDGQQSIYPGGYTLSEAGISVAGRGVVLDVNYRNTAQILDRAELIVAGDLYADIEGDEATSATPSRPSMRTGEAPITVNFRSSTEHDRAIADRVRAVTQSLDTSFGDIGVLCTSKDHAKSALKILSEQRIPTVDLEKYNGQPVDAVKVGTIFRAKGLEFKQVLLPWTKPHLLTPGDATASAPDSMLEREERDRRVLYVGMTRARDGLWISSLIANEQAAHRLSHRR